MFHLRHRPDGARAPLSAAHRRALLNARHGGRAGQEALGAALRDPALGRAALVSSFGAESAVLLHMLAQVAPDLPVLFIDTRLLFPETLAYQQDLAGHLGLTNVQVLRTEANAVARRDPDGALRVTDPDACCDLRKSRPLSQALMGYDSWITGRKRFQAGSRAALPLFEVEPGADRIKLNPLAPWSAADIRAYRARHDLPPHPLVAEGYPSLGCAPCTSRVAPGEDPRAGRWRGRDKTECGIHFVNGHVQRQGDST